MKDNNKIITYLAGPMDDVSIEESRDWREWLTIELAKININVHNPISKYGKDYGNIRKKFSIWKKFGNIDAVRQVVSSKIIPQDLNMVKESDFITLYIPSAGHEICGCVDEGTEIFTLNGFKKYTELKEKDIVISYNLKKKKLEVDKVLDIFKYNYKGKILSLEKRDISMRITPNHRCVIKSSWAQNFELKIKEANELWKHDKVLQTAPFNNISSSRLTRKEGRIIGLILSDGWIRRYRIVICQKVGKKQKIIDKWIEDIDIDYSIRFREINEMTGYYGGKGKMKYYEFHSLDSQRFREILPSKEGNLFYLLNNSQEFLEGIWEGFVLGDGNKRKYSTSFSQKRENISDFIQGLSILLNKRCKKSPNKTYEGFSYLYASNHQAINVSQKKWIDYNGIVWCPRTRNGTWIARRNGTIFITGNSYGEATIAFDCGIPVYIVTRRCLKPLNIPKWMIGCSAKIFTNWEDYIEYIKKNWNGE